MNLIEKYKIYIYERYNDLKRSQKTEYDYYDLAKIFEYYTSIKLYEETGQLFYEYGDISPDFKEQHSMSRNDTGIDLSNLEDTIVQCKLRTNVLTWTEMATFFASNIKEGLGFKWPKYVVARNDCKLSRNLKDITWYQDKVYKVDDMLEYCEALIENPPSIITKEKPKKIELRDYQIECLDLIKNSGNLVICLPTGTGKAVLIINTLDPKLRYLILVPRIILMEQLKEEIMKHTSIKASNIQLIGDNKNTFDKNKCVTICVYNSVDYVYEHADNFEKIFVDEAHHIYRPEIYETEEDTDEEHETFITRIQSLSKFNNNVYLSATIDEIDGFAFYKRDIREMIEAGYLCDYTIHVPIFSNTASNKSICEYLLQNYRNIIIYCQSQKEGKEVNAILNELMAGSSCYIDANTRVGARKKILNDFKLGIIPFLVNVRVLIEGFDAPLTKGVCLLHNPSSQTTLIQILGRALRLHPTKTYANIILPYSIDDDQKYINKFIKILAKNDNRVLKSYNRKNLGGYINIDSIDNHQIEGHFRYENVYNSLGERIDFDTQWYITFEEVKQCLIKVSSIAELKADHKSKWSWIHRNKTIHSNRYGVMTNSKIYDTWTNFISNEPFNIYFRSDKDKWLEMFERTKKCIDTLNRRPYASDEEYKDVHAWIGTNGINYRQRVSVMSDDKIYLMWHDFISNEPYNIFFSMTESWLHKRDKLQEFIDTNDRLPSGYSKDSVEATRSNWFGTQKEFAKNRAGAMKNDLIYKEWQLFLQKNKKYIKNDHVTIWKNTLVDLENYIKEFHRLPTESDKQYKNLGLWTTRQQSNNFKAFPELGIIWNNFINQKHMKKYFILDKDVWLENFKKLTSYYQQYNYFPKQNLILMRWYRINRDSYVNKIGLVVDNNECKILWEKFINDENIDHEVINMTKKEKWIYRLHQITRFIYLRKRVPIQNKIDLQENSYYEWLHGQHYHYSNNGGLFKQPDIKNKWIEFVTDINTNLNVKSSVLIL